MKTILSIVASVMLGLMPYSQSIAACFDQDSIPDLMSSTLTNFDNYAVLNIDTGTYELCFDSNVQFPLDAIAAINVPEGKKLKITGLNLLAGNFGSNAIITLSGSNVIFDDVKLNGNGSGAAIQVYGTNITIKNSTISNFAEGIRVAANASVKLENNIFETIETFTPDHGLAFDPSFISPIDSRLVGKKAGETDTTLIETVIGKINAESCDGSIEMLKFSLVEKKLYKNPTASCSISNIQEKDTKFTFADGAEEVVKAGTCLFTCSNINETSGGLAIFVYTSPDGKSYPFAPMPTKTFADLPNVIAFTIPSEIIPSGYTGDGDDTISAGNVVVTGDVPDGNTPASKAGSPGGSGEGMVSQGAKMGCALVKYNAPSPLNIATLLALTGMLLPIGARRFFAKAKCRK